MTAVSVEFQPWGRRRWWGVVALIFIVQLGVIFWLGSATPIRQRRPAAALTLHLAGQGSTELQALNDPTLFTLPHLQGFSGLVGRSMPRPEFRPFEWSAPTNRLPLTIDPLGTLFTRLVETSEFHPLRLPAQIEAAPTLPDLPPLSVSADQSVLQLEDNLAQRHLLAPLQLRSFTNTDILASSVVQVGVDAGGRAVSVTLLSSSGSPEADQLALNQAWTARFEPLSRSPAETVLKPTAHLSWGRMIFRWHTVPKPPASAPAANP